MQGGLIMLSGIDGSGKSTIASHLQETLLSQGVQNVTIIDAMKGGIYAKQLCDMAEKQKCSVRELATPSLLNMSWTADFIYTYTYMVLPQLQDSNWVIMHRSDLCCRVYSKLFYEKDFLTDCILDRFSTKPKLHFHIQVDPEIAYQRIAIRNHGKPRTEKETLKRLVQADRLYQEYLKKDLYENVVTISNNTYEDKATDIVARIWDESRHASYQ